MKKARKKTARRAPALARSVSALKRKVTALARIHTLPRKNPAPKSLYYELKAAKVPLDHHESDLYVRDTPTARKIIRESRHTLGNFRPFVSEGKSWLEFPFAYTPYWERKERPVVTRSYIPGARRMNPSRGGAVDTIAARELKLFIDNDGQLYRSQTEPIQKNLVRKLVKGTYDAKQAPKLWMYLVDNGAKKYTKDYGSGQGMGSFNKPTRMVVAEELAQEFFSNYRNGEYDHLIPEKVRYKSAKSTPSKGWRRA